MLSVVMYSILTNVCFTLGFLLPDSLPVYYLPKTLLKDFLVAFALALAVNTIIVPVTSRTVFFVYSCHRGTNVAFLYRISWRCICTAGSTCDIPFSAA
jgi:hypothetical protein